MGGHPGPLEGYVGESLCKQANTDFSSYAFNAGNLFSVKRRGTNVFRKGIAGQRLSTIKRPARTVLVMELPAIIPFSWHKPKRPLYFVSTRNCQESCVFSNAMNTISFVDGHVSYVKINWNGSLKSAANDYDPPAEYEYQMERKLTDFPLTQPRKIRQK